MGPANTGPVITITVMVQPFVFTYSLDGELSARHTDRLPDPDQFSLVFDQLRIRVLPAGSPGWVSPAYVLQVYVV
jgi:hypothetical protein